MSDGLPEIGDLINKRYKVLAKIGKGGMGVVYHVTDRKGGRELALKYLNVPPEKPKAIEHFKSEFSKLSRFPHPNIELVHDFEKDDKRGLYFFTSELIDGKDFFTGTRGLTTLQVEALIVQVLRALEYMHSHKLVHFDIKPPNVLITKGPNSELVPKIIDFGVADFGSNGRLAGTPSYMAPEMCLRKIPDQRADLYSLGVMCYHVLAGFKDSPFRGVDRDDTFKRHAEMSLPLLHDIHPEIPIYLSDIIERLLAKDPAERFTHAAEVISEINANKIQDDRYDVETLETRRSYIPDNARFVGRQRAIEDIRLFLQSHQPPQADDNNAPLDVTQMRHDVLWITGEKGIGKSRLLGELNHLAQLNNFVTVAASNNDPDSWDVMRKAIEDAKERPEMAILFWVDDYDEMASNPDAASLISDVTGLHDFVTQLRRLGNKCRIGFAYSGKKLQNTTQDVLHIALKPFTISELADYVISVTGFKNPPTGFVEELMRHTDGNPYFVTEVMRALIDNGMLLDTAGRWKATTFEDLGVDFSNIKTPGSLSVAIALEFNQLTAPEQQLLSLLAVWNGAATISQIQAVLENTVDPGTPAILLKRGWVDMDPITNSLFIPNPQRRMAVESLIGRNLKEAWHFKIGKVLETAALPMPEEVMWHYAHSDHHNLAQRSLRELIEICKTTKPITAISHSKHLLEKLKPNSDDYWKAQITLGQIYRSIRQYNQAMKLFEEVKAYLKQENTNQELLAQVYEDLVITASKQKLFDDAERYCMQGLQVIRNNLKDNVRCLRMENYLSQIFLARGSVTRAVEAFSRTQAEAAQLRMDERAQILNNDLCYALFRKKQYQQVVDETKKEMVFYDEVGNARQYLRMNYLCAESLRYLERYEEAEKQYDHGIASARKRHDAEYLFFHYLGLGNLKGDAKQYKEAIENYTRALDLAVRLNQTSYSLQIMINLGNLHLNNGNMNDAERYCKSVVEHIQSHPTTALEQENHCRAHLSLANIYLERRDFIKAHRHQTAAEEIIKKYPDICEAPAGWVQLTRAQLYLAENKKPKAKPILKLLHSNVMERLKATPSNPELQSLLQEIEVTENTVEEN